MKNLFFCSVSICALVSFDCSSANAATTFLPDWQNAGLNFENNEGNFTRDETLCVEAVDENGNKLYHKAENCPAPKIFDEYCPHDNRYISKCYCPAIYQYTCVAPYRGDERVKENGYASCDGLYIACCDGSCPANTSKTNPGGCGGSTTNECGDTCYYPYQPCCYPESDETGCSCGTYSCSDGCGGYRTCCSSCSSSSGSGGGVSSSNSGDYDDDIQSGGNSDITCSDGRGRAFRQMRCNRGYQEVYNCWYIQHYKPSLGRCKPTYIEWTDDCNWSTLSAGCTVTDYDADRDCIDGFCNVN